MCSSDLLVEKMTALGLVQPEDGWNVRKEQAWKKHFASLGDYYFLRGESRLERLRGWALGRAKRLRRPSVEAEKTATTKTREAVDAAR